MEYRRLHSVTEALQGRIILSQKPAGIGHKGRVSGIGAALGFYENPVCAALTQHQQTVIDTVFILIHPVDVLTDKIVVVHQILREVCKFLRRQRDRFFYRTGYGLDLSVLSPKWNIENHKLSPPSHGPLRMLLLSLLSRCSDPVSFFIHGVPSSVSR